MIRRLTLLVLGSILLAACNEAPNPQQVSSPESSSAGASVAQTGSSTPPPSNQSVPDAPQDGYQQGVHFQVLARPVPTEDPSRVEVAEVFWYGCIHCYRLEPLLEEWVTTLPDDVNFTHVPAIWAPVMETHAKIYYASRALGVLEQTHWPTFQALNRNPNALNTEAQVLNLVADLGIDREQYRRAFNSFGVNSQVTQARSKAAAYGIRGTPEIIVEGRYRIATDLPGTNTQQDMLAVATWLMERARQERASGSL